MERQKRNHPSNRTNREASKRVSSGGNLKSLYFLLLASLLALPGCGGGGASTQSQNIGPLSGNWQFAMAGPSDNSFLGGMQGGFLLQTKGSVTGSVVYSVSTPPQQPGGAPNLCNSGSAPINGTINGQSVTLTATAASQTFTLTGTISADGSTMMGTYTSSDGQGCGTAQTGLQWSAISVPAITGTVQGNFHSVLSSPNPITNTSLRDQDFQVSGALTQGPNTGASSATVTGTLTFQGYPCLDTASVNGEISGTSLILQIIASNGLNVGQIGAPVGASILAPVTFASSGGGAILHGANGYGITTKTCPGGNVPGDVGNICLGLGNATACTEPILLTPASITFPAQQVGSGPTSQTVTLTNTDPSGATLTGLTLSFNPQSGNTSPFGASDFSGLPNFTTQDNCANAPGGTFSLSPQQSCTITISFSPQQSCPWLPLASLGGVAPALCPFPLTATLTVNSSTSADGDTAFALPITGIGLSAIVPSTPELDFGAEAPGETSPPQTLSFTNQGSFPVQILPAVNSPCANTTTLPRPLVPGTISGLQVDTAAITPNGSTISYTCDSDLTSQKPNFQISSDTCSGRLMAPQDVCSLQIAFAPQPSTPLIPAPDYFLELNTLQCTSTTTSNCEIDSGRFPVELTANSPSPLRMSPGAGLDFGVQPKGQPSGPLTIMLFNDPNDPNAGTVNFTGNLVKGDYTETDDCGASLAPGATCTLTVIFKPKTIGFDPGTITITYTPGQIQVVHLRGTGQ